METKMNDWEEPTVADAVDQITAGYIIVVFIAAILAALGKI